MYAISKTGLLEWESGLGSRHTYSSSLQSGKKQLHEQSTRLNEEAQTTANIPCCIKT